MLLLATLATPSLSGAQDSWPARPVKIVVPFAPGGSVDVVIRKIAQKLTEQTHQSFIVENKAGASGTIGAMQVIRSEHDGYTLLANDTTYPLLPHIFKKLPFDYAHDLLPISAFVFAPTTLVVSKASPYKTLDELLAQARAHPGIVTYGSGGAGTLPHFAGEALAIETRSQLLHVPFKGAAEAIQAVLSNTVDAQFASPSVVLGNVRGGKHPDAGGQRGHAHAVVSRGPYVRRGRDKELQHFQLDRSLGPEGDAAVCIASTEAGAGGRHAIGGHEGLRRERRRRTTAARRRCIRQAAERKHGPMGCSGLQGRSRKAVRPACSFLARRKFSS
jgi:hypothetical protein